MSKTDEIKNKMKPKRNAREELMGSNNDSNKDDNQIVNDTVTDDNHIDELDDILNNNNKINKVQKGIYFDPEVAKALNKLVKRKVQSDFVNAATKQALKAKGLL